MNQKNEWTEKLDEHLSFNQCEVLDVLCKLEALAQLFDVLFEVRSDFNIQPRKLGGYGLILTDICKQLSQVHNALDVVTVHQLKRESEGVSAIAV